MLDSEQREQIGFSFIIDKLQIMTPFGIEQKKHIKPFKRHEEKELIRELENVELLIKCIRNNSEALGEIERVFCKVKDIRGTADRCLGLLTLDDIELYEIKYFSLLVEELITAYKKLNVEIEDIYFNSLEGALEILDPEKKRISTFYIYECYSDKLRAIRTEKRGLEKLIIREMDEEKGKLLKKERLNLVLLEESEELSIRKQLTEKLSNDADLIIKNIECIGKLDFLIAKAKLALSYKSVKPMIIKENSIVINNMVNPEVMELLESKNKVFTPVSINLKSGTTVITGANMGGKSVALKTIVLNLFLAQCGFYAVASEARMPILDFIYYISDDLQSVSQGLSTFGAEIVKLRQVVESAKLQNGFIALDEVARGTNPKEGYFLVKSLCKYLNNLNSISLISTHYDGVVDKEMVHYQVIGLKNIDFNKLKTKIDLNKMKSIDIIQEHMEYKLEKVDRVSEVPKDALNISILLGLQDEIIDIAREYYREYRGEFNGK